MRWTVHGERALYESEWVNLTLVDVEIPGHERFEHHVVRMPHKAAGTVVHDPDRGLLLLWRHRVITDSGGWGGPAGQNDAGGTPPEGAGRGAPGGTGWGPRPPAALVADPPAPRVGGPRVPPFPPRA